MPHTIRPHLIASLAALHAVLSLCGPGHHGSADPVCYDRGAGDQVGVIEGATAQPADHCPICDYLSQGQLPIESACLAFGERVAISDRGERPSQRPIPPPLPTLPRAPPIGA